MLTFLYPGGHCIDGYLFCGSLHKYFNLAAFYWGAGRGGGGTGREANLTFLMMFVLFSVCLSESVPRGSPPPYLPKPLEGPHKYLLSALAKSAGGLSRRLTKTSKLQQNI